MAFIHYFDQDHLPLFFFFLAQDHLSSKNLKYSTSHLFFFLSSDGLILILNKVIHKASNGKNLSGTISQHGDRHHLEAEFDTTTKTDTRLKEAVMLTRNKGRKSKNFKKGEAKQEPKAISYLERSSNINK